MQRFDAICACVTWPVMKTLVRVREYPRIPQEPRKALYVSPLADPLIAATWRKWHAGEISIPAQCMLCARGQAVGSCIEASQEGDF